GGTAPGAGNRIAFNTGPGVQFGSNAGPGNAILGNTIFANSKLGIDLGDDGVTANDPVNDPLDADAGPNGLQNFPVLTVAATGASGTTITGLLKSTPNTTFRVELFSSDAADPSGFGEGQHYLGFTTATTSAQGIAAFSFTPVSPVAVGKFITATATDPLNNTSEFSAALAVTASLPGGGSASSVARLFAVGPGVGAAPQVKVYNADGSLRFNFLAYAAGFTGGVRVATGDVTGDGIDDIVTGAGPDAPGGHVKVFDGKTGAEVRSFLAYPG